MRRLDGWRPDGPLNPAGASVTTREYAHQRKAGFSARGDPVAADHVDVLGNAELIEDVLAIAAGRGVEPRILSDSRRVAGEAMARFHAARRRALSRAS